VERKNFTKQYLSDLKTSHQRQTFYDEKVHGLILRVEPTGKKIFCWRRKGDGRYRFKRIGLFPDLSVENARMKASEYNASLARWAADSFTSPSPFEKQRADLTLNDAIEDYCERRLASHSKNPTNACWRVRWTRDKYLLTWKLRRLSSINRKQVIDLHDSLGKKNGHVTANRVVTFLRTVFNWALNSCEWHGTNPASRIERFAERSRERFLFQEEAERLFEALRLEPSKDLQAFVVIALFTGARRNDILSMKWSDLNSETTTWTIADPKSRVPYLVPLMPEVMEILRDRKNNSPWVFPGTGKTGHVTGFKHSWVALLKRAKITGLTIHDLRRSLGSYMATGGESLPVIGKALGHATSLGATSIYARLQNTVVRDAIARATQKMLTGKP
jgi:integrase